MVELTRVPAPRSPFDGRWRWFAGLLAAVLVAVIVKPWDEPLAPEPVTPSAPPSARVAIVPSLPPTSRTYDPAKLGATPPEPAWELLAANRVTTIRFVGPGGFDPIESPAPTPGEDAIVAGPVIELGTTDELAELAINRPRGTDLGAVRLWRLEDGSRPVRVPIVELGSPWPASNVRVFAARRPLMPAETVLAWQPGLYRLDLLIEPIDRIRILLLHVRPGPNQPTTPPPDPPPTPEVDIRLLERLPPEATFWSYGTVLSGWSSQRLARGTCALAEIWRAVDYSDPCRAIPIGRPTAIGVNLGAGREIESVTLREVDPLPGPITLEAAVAVEGRAGLAIVRTGTDRLPDGIYRLDVRTVDGEQLGWYVEASPGISE